MTKIESTLKRLENEQIQSWRDLSELIETCSSGEWIFRGESKDNNDLKPKSGRVSNEIGSPRKIDYDIKDEKKALELFKLQARPYLGYNPSTEIEWLAIAQHHGMHTRLLDWSESLLVAAYFATVNAGAKAQNGVIYGVRNLQAISKRDEKKPFEIKESGIYRPPHITPRIPAQRSVFTIHSKPTEIYEPDGLHRWVISNNTCGKIKKILDTCAINESSLFPDLDGLSRYIGWRYKWGKF